MLAFAYDGSFEGLLNCLFEAYAGKMFPDALLAAGGRGGLLAGETRPIATSPERAWRVYQGLRHRLSVRSLSNVTLAWLSEESGADMLLFRYMRKVFDAARDIGGNLADADVLALSRLARRVCREEHRLTGFARFQKSGQGVYFAALRPRHNVLPLLAPHFAARFAGQAWILYDLGRRYGVLHQNGRLHELALPRALADQLDANGGRLPEGQLAQGEERIQELWRGYFQAVSIEQRANPGLQRRLMPRRYLECLTEKPSAGPPERPPA